MDSKTNYTIYIINFICCVKIHKKYAYVALVTIKNHERQITKFRENTNNQMANKILFAIRVSFKTSFDSKQPKLVSALSETKRLFWLFRFNTETESFDVSIEPKQTEDQPKQFDREHILLFFTENLGFSDFFVFFGFFGFFLSFFRNS